MFIHSTKGTKILYMEYNSIMSYSKQQLYRTTNRLYDELRDSPDNIVLKKLNSNHGMYDFSTDEITLDYRKSLIPTLIHEYLHKWYPDKCESWVLNSEQQIVNALSTRQIKNIIRAFSAAI